MIRFMVTVNDIIFAFPFFDFASIESCRAAAENMAQAFSSGWVGDIKSYSIKCVDRATGLVMHAAEMGTNQ